MTHRPRIALVRPREGAALPSVSDLGHRAPDRGELLSEQQ